MNLKSILSKIQYSLYLFKINSKEKIGSLFNLKCEYGCRRHDKDHDVSKCDCDCHYEHIGRPFRPTK
jgi:hypothetical protein